MKCILETEHYSKIEGVFLLHSLVTERLKVPKGYIISDITQHSKEIIVSAINDSVKLSVWEKEPNKLDNKRMFISFDEFYALFPEITRKKEGFFAKFYSWTGEEYLEDTPCQSPKISDKDGWFFHEGFRESISFIPITQSSSDDKKQFKLTPKEELLKFLKNAPKEEFSLKELRQFLSGSTIYDTLLGDVLEALVREGELFHPEEGMFRLM